MGIASEVSKAILKHSFENFPLEYIIGTAMKENAASCRVLEKVGLTWYKNDEVMGDGGDYRWFKITRAEFEKMGNA
jgi:RimJ/RimL family protein N-acetyltransferase